MTKLKDRDNPSLTKPDLKRLRPAAEVLPEVVEAATRGRARVVMIRQTSRTTGSVVKLHPMTDQLCADLAKWNGVKVEQIVEWFARGLPVNTSHSVWEVIDQ